MAGGKGVAPVPYFVSASRLSRPGSGRSSQGAKSVVFFALLPPSPDLPIEVVIEFLNTHDMVVAVH
jgi:hypothetical protein